MRWARWLVLARLASSGTEVARHAHCTALELRVIGVTLVERADGAAHLAVYPHVNVFAPCVDDPAHFDSNETEVCYSVAPVPNRWHTRAEPPHDTCRAMPLTFPVVFELAFRAQLEVLAFLRRRGRSVGMPRRELIPLLRDEADYFGLVGLVEACEADQAPEPIVAMLHEGFAGLDEGFAGVITALGTLAERISVDPTKSVTSVLCGIEASLDNLPDCSPIDYSDDLREISADIQHLTRRIYDPDDRFGSDDLASVIANH